MTPVPPSLGFVLVFLLFSLLFFRNTYKLWFKTDEYYQDIYNSLAREPSIYPFRQFFLKRMENKERWVLWQKGFSLLGLVAVLAADVLVVMDYVANRGLTLSYEQTFRRRECIGYVKNSQIYQSC